MYTTLAPIFTSKRFALSLAALAVVFSLSFSLSLASLNLFCCFSPNYSRTICRKPVRAERKSARTHTIRPIEVIRQRCGFFTFALHILAWVFYSMANLHNQINTNLLTSTTNFDVNMFEHICTILAVAFFIVSTFSLLLLVFLFVHSFWPIFTLIRSICLAKKVY